MRACQRRSSSARVRSFGCMSCLGALKRLQELELRYDILEESPIHFDMTFKASLKAMGPYLPPLRHLGIRQVRDGRMGGRG